MKVEIDFGYSSVINFAMQQNHVPILRKVILRNITDFELNNCKLTISVSPVLAESLQRHIDIIPPNSSIEINDFQVNISPQYLSEITERICGEISISFFSNEEEIASKKYPIDILPFDQWGGISVLPEILSAFVTPNYPTINTIIHKASQFLEKWTGSPSLDEYQTRNSDRVKNQMAAIYEAIAEQNIVYCTPPANYEESGQRIRMYDTIMNHKLGTCIDMALLYASCLEAVGINPIVVITKGHAFSGGWLINDTFADSVNDDISLLTKRIADGINEIALVETTCMNSGKNIDFDSAMASAQDHLNNTSNFLLSVDIKRCRFAGLRPLPLRTYSENGIVFTESDLVVRKGETPQSINPDVIVIESQSTEVSKQRLWERKLLDLSLRNNLLNIRLTKNTLQLISVNINLLEDALADGHEFQVLEKPLDWDNELMDAGIYQSLNQTDPITDLVKQELSLKRLRSYLSEYELKQSLTNVYRSSRISMEENGANTLYLALGLLKWYETPNSERPRFAPLLLLPVEIIRKSAQKGYVIRSREEEVMMNITLLEMLKQDFGINIGGLETLPKDQSGVDVKLIFNIIRKNIMNQTRWNVEEQAILGIFSFNKFIMWNDIHNNADKLCKNRIVKSLISGMIEWNIDQDDEFNLDADIKPSDIILPISADSFQIEAICNAAKGKSFILHGPPGTGKSQTITNIIADALYNGKKVLFVAEKMAALSVVQKRLSDIGIAPFCLELHSNKSKKSSVLEQLKATTEVVKTNPPESYTIESERLFKLRCELSKYVEILHHKHPSGYSLYEALYSYNNKNNIGDDFEFPSSIAQDFTKNEITNWRDIVEQMQIVATICQIISTHPLKDINLSNYSLSLKTEIKDELSVQILSLNKLSSITSNFLTIFEDINCSLSTEQLQTLDKIAVLLLNNPLFISSLLKPENLNDTITQIKQVIPHGLERNKVRENILKLYSKNILSVDADRLLVEWNITETKWFLPKLLSQNKIVKSIRIFSLNGTIDKHLIKGTLTDLIRYQAEQQIINNKSSYYSELLGTFWANGECEWDYIEECCKSSLAINDLLLYFTGSIEKSLKMRQAFSEKLSQGTDSFLTIYSPLISEFSNLLKETINRQNKLISKLNISSQLISENWNDESFKKINIYLDNIELLKDWCSWNDVKKRAIEEGLGSFVDYISFNKVNPLHIIGTFDKAVFKGIINTVIDTEPTLANFNGKLFEDKIRKFRELTAQFEKLTREELFAKLASNIPSFTKEASQSSEVGILQRNIRNNGRGTSIRKLFESIPTLLSRITPCMLMSPMSVAQYIDPENVKFDLVIFDEASQMPTCEAVGAIARGHNVIVVGDPKQMPPTNFFSSNSIDEDNLDKEDLESILDDCLALSIPSKYLLWHYRSKHESLIAFSNSQYYDNKLFTFPSPDDIKSKVTYKYIDGYYDKGKSRQNRAEAEAVIKEILTRLSNKELSKRSIGVVTFSSVQQTLVEDLLNEAFTQNPQIEAIALDSAEPLFIKNLENVQGDERDVILFSVGYGPDKDDKVSLNFGPLNREGGWRRLNVAVSRARYEMKVFSTLKADKIDLSRTSSEGVAGLKAFLEYAEKGKNAMVVNSGRYKSMEKSLVDIIADKIREQGYDVHTNIGCSGYRVDIGIVNPRNNSEYILGLICDGNNYKAAKTVRDREIIQQDVLKMLGWNIHRVWTMDWVENAEKILSEIISAIQQKPAEKEEDIAEKVPDTVLGNEFLSNIDQLSIEETESIADNPRVEESSYKIPYNQHPLESFNIPPEEFLKPNRLSYISFQILRIIENEAPISRDQLCRRVLSLWGMSRIGSRIEDYFNEIFSLLNLKFTGTGKDLFFWREDQEPMKYMNYRIFASNASDIAPEEVSVTVKEVLENQISLSREDLIKETARLLGFNRLGTIVEPSMQKGIDMAIKRGFAKAENGRIILNL